MAITENNVPIRPVTGIARIDNAGSSSGTNKAVVPLVVNPAPTTDATFSRLSKLLNGSTTSFLDIQNGYMVDSYIHTAVSRYAEKVVKEGFYLSGQATSTVKYIQTRFDMMTASTGEYWQTPLVQALRDYVKFGNAFLVKARHKKGANLTGPKVKGIKKIQGLGTKGPIGGYYCMSPLYMSPGYDSDRVLINWKLSQPGASTPIFLGLDDVIHITYDKQSGGLYGVSWISSVLDDVRALRSMEEMVIQLIFKNLNPLVHHEVPDSTGTGRGRQEDVAAAAAKHDVMAVNGYIITPPGHKINVIGVESKALRAEGYLQFLRERVYAGLGVNPVMMGESGTSGVGVAESFTAIMHDRVRYFQKEFADTLTYRVIWELLAEGGFLPTFTERDRVFWNYNEVDVDRRVREEAHALLKYHGNAITETELRMALSLGSIADTDRKNMYLNLVQIPQIKAKGSAPTPPTAGGATSKAPDAGANDSTESRHLLGAVKHALSALVQKELSAGAVPSNEDIAALVSTCVDGEAVRPTDATIDSINYAVALAVAGFTSQTGPALAISRIHAYMDIYTS